MAVKKAATKSVVKDAKQAGRDIGLGMPAPAKECDDVNCPWHGSLPVRGKILKGTALPTKMQKTAIVEWGYHKFYKKYESYERRKSRVNAHNPPCLHAREGDSVVLAECRPLSKTKKFVVVSISKRKGER